MSSKARPPQHVDDVNEGSDLPRCHPEDSSETEPTRVHASGWQSDSPADSRTLIDVRSGENPTIARTPTVRPLTPPNPLPTFDLDSTRAAPPGAYLPENLKLTESLLEVEATQFAPLRPALPAAPANRANRPGRNGVSFSALPDNVPSFFETTATRFAPIQTGTLDAAPLPFAEIPEPVKAPPDKSLDRKLMILAGVAVGLVLASILLNLYG